MRLKDEGSKVVSFTIVPRSEDEEEIAEVENGEEVQESTPVEVEVKE